MRWRGCGLGGGCTGEGREGWGPEASYLSYRKGSAQSGTVAEHWFPFCPRLAAWLTEIKHREDPLLLQKLASKKQTHLGCISSDPKLRVSGCVGPDAPSSGFTESSISR